MAVWTIALGLSVLGATWARGQDAPADSGVSSVPIPETPVGEQLRWLLSVFSGAPAEVEEVGGVAGVGGRLADSFKEAIAPEVLARQLQMVTTSILEGGPTVLESIGPGMDAHSISGRLRSEANGVVLAFRLAVDPETGLITMMSNRVIPGSGKDAAASWEVLSERVGALRGTANLYVARVEPDGSLAPLASVNPGARLAIGSTFKLYVLGALAEEVRDGRRRWDEPLAIRDAWKSLPSGEMQLDPEGTEHPLSEHALKMISISDNTATDHLVLLLGRERVEAFMVGLNGDPARNTPLLTTRDMFAMKLGADRTLADRYIASDVAARRAMLAEGGEVGSAVPSMIAAAMWKAPAWIDTLEWFATAEECGRLIVAVDALSKTPQNEPVSKALRANPGIPFDRSIWSSIAYKGGSEPGVLNLTWLVDRADGARFVLSVGWNDPKAEVDLNTLIDLAGQGFGLLAKVPSE
ncbi:MAG: serine hydrolase [Phycisphaeraceae bacterium]|nr:serine hydrolase [Phycisphaeraceae bacterium]